MDRRNDGPIPERCKAYDPHVDAYGITLSNRLLNFALCLYGCKPLAIAGADGYILDVIKDLPAVPVAQPAKLWKENSTVALI